MLISIYAIPGEPLKIQPDPAIAHAGDRIVWEAMFDTRWRDYKAPVRWTIYFQYKNPFTYQVESKWSQRSEPDQKVIIDCGKAEEPGDYKYGVRIMNAETDRVISDDDPRLIVLPPIAEARERPEILRMMSELSKLIKGR